MSNPKLKLVYNAATPSVSQTERAGWGDYAAQPGLFDNFNRVRMVPIIVSEFNLNSFRRVLKEVSPGLILDTRKYPEFYAVYASLDDAIKAFGVQGAKYVHAHLSVLNEEKPLWPQLAVFKKEVDAYLQRPTNAPIVLLSATDYSMAKLLDRVGGFISQEIDGARLVEPRH